MLLKRKEVNLIDFILISNSSPVVSVATSALSTMFVHSSTALIPFYLAVHMSLWHGNPQEPTDEQVGSKHTDKRQDKVNEDILLIEKAPAPISQKQKISNDNNYAVEK